MSEELKPEKPISSLLPQNPLLQRGELTTDTFEVPETLSFWQRWTRGRRLVGVIVLAIIIGYISIWGREDYQRLKNWRGRQLAAQGLQLESEGKAEEGRKILEQAVILAPQDVTVLRTLIEFCERQSDPMALYALRRLISAGKASEPDYERLCRLSKSSGHPEMEPVEALSLWSAKETKELAAGQIVLSSAWLTGRGRQSVAAERLQEGLALYPDSKELKVALLEMLIMNPNPEFFSSKIDAVLTQVSELAKDKSLPLKQRDELSRKMTARLLHSDFRSLLTERRRSSIVDIFKELGKEAGMPDALKHELVAFTLEATDPTKRMAILGKVPTLGVSLPLSQRLPTVQWLNENGQFDLVMKLCDDIPDSDKNPEWFTARLDALFAKKDFVQLRERLNASGQPLAEVTRQFYLYRIDMAEQPSKEFGTAYRPKIREACKNASAEAVFKVALVAERVGDRLMALDLYKMTVDDERTGLQARLGMVRCLDGEVDRVSELIRALESVLSRWPYHQDALNDLIYVRLLEKQVNKADVEIIAHMAKQSPWLAAYQVTAALAKLRKEEPEEALKLLTSASVPWEKVQKGWQAIYAATLAANNRKTEAQEVADRLKNEKLRPSERELLNKYLGPN